MISESDITKIQDGGITFIEAILHSLKSPKGVLKSLLKWKMNRKNLED